MPRTTMAFTDGISLSDIGAVLQQQHEAGHALIAVIGALPAVTDLLHQSIELGNYRRVFTRLLSIHSSAGRTLVRSEPDRQLLLQDITDILENYEWLGRSLVNRQPMPDEVATILTVGERLSTRLLAGYLQFQGIPARAMAEAVNIQAQTTAQLNALLDSQTIVIVGRDLANRYETSALLAATTHSTGLWIMLQQDGILTADPDVYPSAESVPVVPLDILADLYEFGLPVPTEPMLRPAVDAHIPIFIRNVHNPTHPGTYIQPRSDVVSDSTFMMLIRRNVRLLTLDSDIDLQPTLISEKIQAITSDRQLIINNDEINLARLALSRSHPGLAFNVEPQHYALILLTSMSPGLLRQIETILTDANITLYHALSTQIATEKPFLSILIDTESIAIAVEKIHTLTVQQLK